MKRILVWCIVALFPSLILVVTLSANMAAIKEWRLGSQLKAEGVTTSALRVDQDATTSLKTFSTYTITYRFVPTGRPDPITVVRPVDAGTFQRLSTKTNVSIRYFRQDPRVSDIEGNDVGFFVTLFALVLDLVVMISFAAAIYAANKQRKQARS
jgi:hypothetical protein